MRWLLLCVCLAACGLHDVELGAVEGEVVLLDGLPSDTPRRFASADAARDPMLSFSHPENGAALPINLPPLTFAWSDTKKMGPGKAPMAERVFELSLACAGRSLRIYTTQPQAVAPIDAWSALLQGAAGEALTIQVRYVELDQKVRSSEPVTIGVQAPLAEGWLYFWSESGGSLQRRSLASDQSEQVASAQEVACAGCWALSADGARLLQVRDTGALRITTLATGEQLGLNGSVERASVDACDVAPDRDSAVVMTASASSVYRQQQEPLALANVTSFAFASEAGRVAYVRGGTVPMMGPPMMPMMMMGTRLEEARLGETGELTDAVSLVQTDKGDDGARHLAYTHDQRLLAFERTKGPDAKESALAVVSLADGKVTALDKGSKRDGWPSFVSSTVSAESWLLFSSERDGPLGKPAGGKSQLWLWFVHVASDGALEPAAAPLWLPAQSSEDSNLRPLWRAR